MRDVNVAMRRSDENDNPLINAIYVLRLSVYLTINARECRARSIIA